MKKKTVSVIGVIVFFVFNWFAFAKEKPKLVVFDGFGYEITPESCNFHEELYQFIKDTVNSTKGFEFVLAKKKNKFEPFSSFDDFFDPPYWLKPSKICGADINMHIISGESGLGKAEIWLCGIETGKCIIATIADTEELKEFPSNDFRRDLNTIIKEGLSYSEQLCKVYADELIDIPHSVVSYDLATNSGKNIKVEFDYSDNRERIELQKVRFIEENTNKEGEKIYELSTDEGPMMRVVFIYENGELSRIKLKPKYKPTEPNEERIFTVVSKSDYKLNFVCKWKDGSPQKINIKPAICPYKVEISSNRWRDSTKSY